jgi:hypothetical protein
MAWTWKGERVAITDAVIAALGSNDPTSDAVLSAQSTATLRSAKHRLDVLGRMSPEARTAAQRVAVVLDCRNGGRAQ